MDQTCNLTLSQSLPLVCLCSLFSFLCGVGIGANDLSANFAMVVGSGSLNMRRAIVYCTVFELLGAAFMGGNVSGMIRNGIIDTNIYLQNRNMVLIGMTCASFTAAIWLYLSAFFGLPVSITHTVVGTILGFAIFSTGSFSSIQPRGIVAVVSSWLLAPLAAGVVTSCIFYYMRRDILKVKGKSFQFALWSLPYCLGFSLLVDFAFIVIERPPILSVTIAQILPLWVQYVFFLLAIVYACICSHLFIFPKLADEAQQLDSFVWESEVIRTEPECPPVPVPMSAPAVIVSEDLARSFFTSRESDGQASSILARSVESRPSVCVLSTLDLSDAKMVSQQTVRIAPVIGRRSVDIEEETSYGTMLTVSTTPKRTAVHWRKSQEAEERGHREGKFHEEELRSFPRQQEEDRRTRNDEDNAGEEDHGVRPLSPVSVASHDVFADDDWAMDHPVQPIRFGGLLIKPFNPRAEYLYTGLQVVAGSMSSFVHGAVAGANATAAFVILYDTFAQAELKETQINTSWAVLPAMFGIAIGMFTLGSRLMRTIGMELVTVTPARGWCIQVGGTFVTMILTGIGIPVSLSQSQVGAAIGCGVLDAQLNGVRWSIVFKIIGGWVVTLVIGSATTGFLMWILSAFYCG